MTTQPQERDIASVIEARLERHPGDKGWSCVACWHGEYCADKEILKLARDRLRAQPSPREVALRECAQIADDAQNAAAAMVKELPAWDRDHIRSRAAESTARMIGERIRALSPAQKEEPK